MALTSRGWAGGRRFAGVALAMVVVVGAVLAAGAGPARAAEAGRTRAPANSGDEPDTGRVMVKYRSGSSLAADGAGAPRHAARLGRQLSLALEDGRVLGPRSQSLRARGISAAALASRLAALPEVEWAEPVRRKSVQAGQLNAPNDPLFADGQAADTPSAGQWYLRSPDATLVAAINAVGAWDITPGVAGITVAVVDSGVRFDHPDLAPKLWPGYDFVSRSSTANDDSGATPADSRDADASDPGDWSGSTRSGWHGTRVAGLIGAASDNGIGIAGVGRDLMLLPVRVLGKGGGFDDDIVAGMRWAGGLSNSAACQAAGAAATLSATCNPHPARVINLSLGSSGACGNGYRDAIAALNAAGVVVVVAAGNERGHAVNEPANCPGAIAVAGVRHAGTKVGYSNIGPQVALAAPAGNCVNLTGTCLYPLITTTNDGATTPGASTYSDGLTPTFGTSFAAPLVAGTAGLMLSLKPSLTAADVKRLLQDSARAFPTSGAQEPGTVDCRAPDGVDQIECYCTTSTCGAGLLDAGAAVARVQSALLAPVAVVAASTTTPTVGNSVTLDAAGATASSGRSIVGHAWSLVTGAGIASFVGATDGRSVTLATSGAGSVVVQLTVTDSTGATGSQTLALTVAAAPVVVTPTPEPASSGGGGALQPGWLLALAGLVGLLVLTRRPDRTAQHRG